MNHNIFKMLGVENRELSYSNFLAWLLNPNVNGDVGTEFLKELLSVVKSDVNISDSSVNVFREKEKKNSIADIVVEHEEFLLIIENKVKSEEGKNQTERLYEDWSGSGKDEIFVFLTPEYRNGPNSDNFTHITYTDIRDMLNHMDLSNYEKRTKIMIKDYIETLEVNRMVEFEGFSEESIEYMKSLQEIRGNESFWKKERDNLFNEVEKLLENEGVTDNDWYISNKRDRIRIAKKTWDNGLSIKCIFNDNAAKGGYVKMAVYAIKKGVDNRKRKWKEFYDRYDGGHKSTKYKWIEEKDDKLFGEIINDKYNSPERIKDKILEYIEAYGKIIDEVMALDYD